MYVEPGQGNAAHTHEVEECFFVLQGFLDVFVEDESGKRLTTRLGPWECISCPAGVIHGYQNDSLGPVYFQVMLGRGKPETMGYADDDLYKRRDAHLARCDASAITERWPHPQIAELVIGPRAARTRWLIQAMRWRYDGRRARTAERSNSPGSRCRRAPHSRRWSLSSKR